jgi:cytochrome d ubiquinol oxidase subunit II
MTARSHAKFLGPSERPFALLVGVVSLSMLLTHGAAWLGLKSEGVIVEPARGASAPSRGSLTMVGFALAGLWLAVGIDGYAFAGPVVTDGPSNPLCPRSPAPAAGCRLCRAALDRVAPAAGLSRHRHGHPRPAVGLRGGHALWSKLGITG